MSGFHQSLGFGKMGESAIAMWARRRGWLVLPVYEKSVNDYKGPTLFTPDDALIAPDMLFIGKRGQVWVEAKHKTAFTWHQRTSRWTTGIDLHHYQQYLKVAELSPWPVWILFLHEGGQAKDSPAQSPTGLFGNRIEVLRDRENHRHQNWGRTGMVYWARRDDGGALLKIAEIEDVLAPVEGVA